MESRESRQRSCGDWLEGLVEKWEVTVLAPTFSWVRMESRQRSHRNWLMGLVKESR
jgi:hypothetical protein